MNYKAVIFDLDGVIVHTDMYHYKAWKKIADELGIYFDEVINNRLRGVSREESLNIILENYKGEPLSDKKKQEALTKKNDYYKTLLDDLSPKDVEPEIKDLLKKLKSLGIKIAIGSSSKNAMFILNKIGLLDEFDGICDGTMIEKTKPNPEVFLKSAKIIGISPNECICVEDALAGVEAGKASNMITVAVGDASLSKVGDYNVDDENTLQKVIYMLIENYSNYDEGGKFFGSFKVFDDTWVITYRWKNFIYLLEGKDKAILIDTGYGEGNLREIVEEITDKPIMVINTHGHFDHTGGNDHFEKVYMAEEAKKEADFIYFDHQKEWKANHLYPNYEKKTLNDGDIIELGDRAIEVMKIGAHSDGSIALIDSKRRLLFSGDEIESGQVIMTIMPSGKTLEELALDHKKNMERLLQNKEKFDFICPSHSGMFLNAEAYINDYLELDNKILSGDYEIKSHTGGFGFPTNTLSKIEPNPFSDWFRIEHKLAAYACNKVKGSK